jgi:hypothetical protein
MARNISVASLAKLAENYGTEPINIVEIQWVANGPRDSYADREIASGIKGRILDIADLDNVIQVSGGGQSQQITVKMDDTDGSIKTILDNNDIHKRPCWVYQWFDGLDVAEKFLIFKGLISSPIIWNEGDRTVEFTVISQIEDTEVGFSIEEGDFRNPPEDLIGKPWPLCFGTVINVPCLKMQSARQGVLATGVGIADFQLVNKLAAANKIICPQNFEGYRATQDGSSVWGAGPLLIQGIYLPDQACQKAKCEAIEATELKISEQYGYQANSFQVFGGERFPQGRLLTLDINGGKFTGTFSGDVFSIQGRRHPRQDSNGLLVVPDPVQTVKSACGTNAPNPNNQRQEEPPDGEPGVTQTLYAAASKRTWEFYHSIEEAGFFWASPGATVTIDSDQEIIYIANILPSTILRVAAWREFDAGRQLITVPSNYYTVRQVDYTGYQVMEIVFDRPLSSRKQGWEDDIYVTLTSSVGPNTVDILEWFIETYTDFAIDSTSFDHVRTLIDNYPMHFPLLERKNIIDVLQEIAFQARCALWLKDDEFFIKYLAEEPTADDTIGVGDVEANSLSVLTTPTEDLVTKYIGEWKKDYAIDDPNRVILRHNVAKYGTQEETYNFYCFNILELVRKAATFWLIRKANTWRKVKFETPIHKLNLEVFDTVSLTVPSVAPGTIKAVVEQCNYDSNNRTLQFELWTPLRAGSQTPYDFAWPADVDERLIFPTLDERLANFAGSGQAPNFSVIAPNQHPLSNSTEGLFSGFTLQACTNFDNLVNEDFPPCRGDFGDQRPSDRFDQKPFPAASQDQVGEISDGTDPLGGSGGQSSNCCAEARAAKALADQAMKEAQQAREEAAKAAQSAGQGKERQEDEETAKENLPDKGCSAGNCEAVATIRYLKVSQVATPPPGLPTSEPGASGKILNGTDAGEECYTFNSAVAAQQFRQSKVQAMQDLSNAYGAIVGETYPWVTSTADSNLGIDQDPDSPNFGNACPEPAAEEQAMTGHSGSTPA